MDQNPFLFNINHIKDIDLTKDEWIHWSQDKKVTMTGINFKSLGEF